MSEQVSKLSEISLIARNYGDGIVLEDVLNDWFEFLGGKPGEVIIVDAGSNAETLDVYWKLYKQGMIDKIQFIHPDHDERKHHLGFVQIYRAGAIATKPYVLWFNIDTLPYRKGHEGWLEESLGYLDRDEVMSVGGSFNLPSKSHDAWDGWYYSYKCSLNFALMKRTTFMAAMHEYAGDYIKSGFKGVNPAIVEYDSADRGRYILEIALERYIERHAVFTLCKVEDVNWTVFHTNLHEHRLKATREKYRVRKDVKRYMNVGFSDANPDPAKALYYGHPPMPLARKLRIAFGKSQLGPFWRSVKHRWHYKPKMASFWFI
ncbi:MAG: glycosyltransferase family 2 protein [Cyanobacteria bacterium CRU_2_1]|nr:glycosyltransferase family 2 protein [Cyanobacteria bacterium RU_5_0]NJR58863.1 glycosyltransferase family 2 protein [Cyanobacteria bacterium CRU_2_1]